MKLKAPQGATELRIGPVVYTPDESGYIDAAHEHVTTAKSHGYKEHDETLDTIEALIEEARSLDPSLPTVDDMKNQIRDHIARLRTKPAKPVEPKSDDGSNANDDLPAWAIQAAAAWHTATKTKQGFLTAVEAAPSKLRLREIAAANGVDMTKVDDKMVDLKSALLVASKQSGFAFKTEASK